MTQHEAPDPEYDVVPRTSILDLVRIILNGKLVILAVIAVFVAAAMYVSFTGTRQYRVSYIVSPAQNQSDPLKSMFSAFDILGGKSQSPDFAMYLELLTTTTLAERITARGDLLQRLFPNDWDPQKKAWKPVTFWHVSMSRKIGMLLGRKPWNPSEFSTDHPTAFTLASYVNKYLSVVPLADKVHYAVSIDSPDPQTSLELLRALHAGANDMVRESRLQSAQMQKAHLMSELATTSVTDYRTILQQLLSRVETSIMMSGVQGQYAAQYVEYPYISPIPVFPKPKQYIVFAIIGGLVAGTVLVLFTPLNDAWLRWFIANLRYRVTVRRHSRAAAKQAAVADHWEAR
jgi:uncharacterized protein involved in exopolysaccharide biosynthesis